MSGRERSSIAWLARHAGVENTLHAVTDQVRREAMLGEHEVVVGGLAPGVVDADALDARRGTLGCEHLSDEAAESADHRMLLNSDDQVVVSDCAAQRLIVQRL